MIINESKDFFVDIYARNDDVTGTCVPNEVHFPDGKYFCFIIDAGIFQGQNENTKLNQEFSFDIEKINSVLVTHNHMDHVGLLPLLVKNGYNNHIFTSYSTSKLIDLSLYDCAKKKDYDLCKRLYNSEDVDKTLDLIVGVQYKRVINLHKYVTATMYMNGHLVGASLILVVISYPGRDNITLLYTGDYNDKNAFVKVRSLPREVQEMNISALITESTYGDKDSTSPEFRPCLVNNIKQAMKQRKTIIFPAFSQGRCQEILLLCKQLQQKGIIPEDIPVWLDGYSSIEYTNRYLYEDLGIDYSRRNFLPKNFNRVIRKEKNKIREQLITDTNPKIIIASGGMGVYGPIQKYISSYLEREDVLIHYLGYCSPESKADKLVQAKYGDQVSYGGLYYTKKCVIKKTGEISAHAKRDELLEFKKSFRHISSILIGHGDQQVRKSYASYLHDNMNYNLQIANLGSKYVYRIGPNGIMNTIPTHFE